MTPSASCLRIAIVGAESTGKTTLARELAAALAARPGAAAASPQGPAPAGRATRRVALVGEVLREWCDAQGRTPRADEQQGILLEQHRRIEAAAGTHDIVVSDTTALMTHVYSDLLFGDRSLLPLALQRHRTVGATLLTALDLPWVADGHQRDGEHVRQPVDDRLREVLLGHRLPFAVVSGRGPARLQRALAALRPILGETTGPSPSPSPSPSLLPSLLPSPSPSARTPVRQGSGLFTRLEAAPAGSQRLGWVCDCCVPEAELALQQRARAGRPLAGAGAAGRT